MFIEIIETLRLTLDQNVIYDFISRLLDAWEKRILDTDQINATIKLCLQYGKISHKATSNKLLCDECEFSGFHQLRRAIEMSVDHVLSEKVLKKQKIDTEFWHQSFKLLEKVLISEARIVLDGMSDDILGSLISKMTDLLTSIIDNTALTSSLALLGQLLSHQSIKYRLRHQATNRDTVSLRLLIACREQRYT